MPIAWGRTLAITTFAALIALTGCSGGDDGDDGTSFSLSATVTGFDANTYSSQGVVCISFTVTGAPNSVIDLLMQYQLAGTSGFAGASASPPALSPPVPPGIALTGLVIGPGGTISGNFYWYAGADLGFLASVAIFSVTPFSNGNPNQPNGSPGLSGPINYGGGQPSVGSSGQGAGTTGGAPPTGAGRASHTSTNVRTSVGPGAVKNLVVAGGYNSAVTAASNAFNTADRFNFNQNTFQHTLQFSGPMTGAPLGRVLHAASFFLDPATGLIKVLVSGGVTKCDPSQFSTANPLAGRIAGATEYATGSVYCFSPTEQVVATFNDLASSRFGHTATWLPNNTIVILGGATNVANPTALAAAGSIEIYDPSIGTNGSFGPPPACTAGGPGLSFPRVEHTATLLADGRVLICGGYNPASPATALQCEIYDPTTGCCVPVQGTMNRSGHTSTRLANGWVLVAGGRSLATGNLLSDAMLFKPELGGFDPNAISMGQARALHAATLLGSRQVLITGGQVADSPVAFTQGAEVFRAADCFSSASPVGFTSVNPMTEPRGEHTATAVDCGSVFIIGGRNEVSSASGLNFLDSIEFYAFSNSVPVISQPATSAQQGTNVLGINFSVTDADLDGGYVIIRFRTAGGNYRNATISSQTPSSAPNGFPNHEVCPGNYLFVWNFGADGLSSGQIVDIQILPFGAVIGSPVNFTAQIP